MKGFTHYIGIDWSGAKGTRHGGIAVAMCPEGNSQPKLISPPSGMRRWGRVECANWIKQGCGLGGKARLLVGFDSAFSLPYMDRGCFLPESGIGVDTATSLWPLVENHCGDAPDLFGGPFADQYANHYHRPKERGQNFSRRMRVTEQLAISSGAGPCESVFHLIGPSQVGLSGLSSMRLLHHMRVCPRVAIWPFMDVPDADIVLVEIYAAAFAALGGHRGKIRDDASLKKTLATLGACGRLPAGTANSDHAADAMVTAAGLRHVAASDKYWHPEGLSSMVRRTEGWIFGVS